ncbi:MAG TPA: HEAT repeat domain-containing protein [Planctomycetes bacterium]|nr:HEAT repeat domain-containing protein [Planctomycetota bacterium]
MPQLTGRRPGRRGGIVPFLCAFSMLAFAGVGRGDDRAALVELLRAEPSAGFEEELAGLAEACTGDLFLVFVEGGIPGPWLPNGGKFARLDPGRAEQVRRALEDLSPDVLRAFLTELAEGEGRLEYRRRGLELLGGFAGVQDLRLCIRLAAPLRVDTSPSHRKTIVLPPAHRTVFRETLEAILSRDIGAFPMIVHLFPDIDASLSSAVVDALRDTRSSLGFEALAALLARPPAPDAYTLRAIRAMAAEFPGPYPPSVRSKVRALLDDPDPEVQRISMETCADLEDWEAFPSLLDGLRDERERTRTAAVSALRILTGLHFGPTPRLWESWYREELEWSREERAVRLQDIESGDAGAALAAISDFAHHRYERSSLALDLTAALDRPEPELVALACRALGELGSPVACGRLVDLLESRDGDVRTAALGALQRITGGDLPEDVRLWREWVGAGDPR